MNILLYDDQQLRIAKRLAKYGDVTSVDTFDAWVQAASAEDYDYHILNVDTPTAQPVAKHIHECFPGAVVILLADDPGDQAIMESHFARYALRKDAKASELRHYFLEPNPKGNPNKTKVQQPTGHMAPVIPLGPEAASVYADQDANVAVGEDSYPLPSEDDEADSKESHTQSPELAYRRERRPLLATLSGIPRYWYAVVAVLLLLGAFVGVKVLDGPGQPKATTTQEQEDATAPAAEPAQATETEAGSFTGWLLSPTGYGPYVAAAATAEAVSIAHGEAPPEPVPPADGQPEDSAAGDTGSTTSSTSTGTDDHAPAPAPAPAPEPEPAPTPNHAPNVSISGPTDVSRGSRCTYTASASDPDGDSVSLSWTSRTVEWTSTGWHTLAVTGTDSQGKSSTASISVHVF